MNHRFKKWISIKSHQNARGLLLIAIVLFNLFLWFFSSVLAFVIAPDQYGNIVRALWESGITWMLEPGFYDPSVVPSIRIISIVVIILSMITFTGGIIGYVGNLFSSIIDHAKQGKSNLYIYDHILILNWNNKALELIADYRYDDETTSIVILSHHDKETIEDAIRRKLYEAKDGSKKKLDIIVRTGEVFSKADLMAVCVNDAKSIIILSDETHAVDESKKDMLAMKTLMLVSNMDLKHDQTILVEVKEQDSIRMIRDYIAKNAKREHQILPILPDELMGRLIAQTLLMPELNQVYHELLSFEGAEFYTVQDIDALTFIKTHNKAIPIYNHQGYLYVLAGNQSSIHHKRSTPLADYQKIEIKVLSRYHEKHIVIFGRNQKLDFILDSIRLYERENQTTIQTTLIDSNQASVISETTDAIEKIDQILILSADHLNPENYDSDVLVTLLMTQEIAKKHSAEIIIELLDPKHFDIAQSYNVKNTIISNEYISHLMTQLSKNRNLYDLFMDLLTYDAEDAQTETYEVYAYIAKDILNTSFPLTFQSKAELIYSIYMSGAQNYIVIGTMIDGKLKIFKDDLDHEEPIIIKESDQLVIICK